MAARYAIYFIPAANTALYRFGSAAIGYDCHTGRELPFLDGVGADWATIVREPRVYGFHATLKAPFRLLAGCQEADLLQAVRLFAEDQPVIDGGRLALRALGSFIALVPAVRSQDIDRLATRCVRDFEPFRAPLTGEERARRLKSGLTGAQIELLERWGYPYVFEEFRFHMTLTGTLDTSKRVQAFEFLSARIERDSRISDLLLDRIVVSRQDEGTKPFRAICTAALGHSVYRPFAYSF